MLSESAAPKVLTPRKVMLRIKKISEQPDARQATKMRRQLMRALIRAVATDSIRAPRKCAQIIHESLPKKAVA